MKEKILILSPNSALILQVLKDLSNQNFIKKDEINDNQIFFWAARQLVKKQLLQVHNVNLKDDTIYRHFILLNKAKMINYIKVGCRDCFILYKQIKEHFACKFKKDVKLDKKEIEEIFNKNIKNKLLNFEVLYQRFQDYYKNNGFKFKVLRVLKEKWADWCRREQPLKLNLEESGLKLNSNLIKIAKKYIQKDEITDLFTCFKLHHISKSTQSADWLKTWELWIINSKKINSNLSQNNLKTTKEKEKVDYRWDFRKAKDVSDKIKDRLEFDKKINWLDDFYWKDIPIPDIGWQKVQHPDFNKEEILLYKINSTDGSFMLNHN